MNCTNNQDGVPATSIRQYLSQRRLLTTTLLCVFGLYSGKVAVAPAAVGTESSKLGIANLAWIQGSWHAQGTASGGQGLGKLDANAELEERWSVPMGDSMVGTFRWIKDGKVWMFEFLTIVEQGEDIFLRWKHFSRDLVGWEKKDASLSYRLIELQDRKAVFEQVEDATVQGPWRVTYHRTDDKSLTIRLESKGIATAPDVFRFRLRQ